MNMCELLYQLQVLEKEDQADPHQSDNQKIEVCMSSRELFHSLGISIVMGSQYCRNYFHSRMCCNRTSLY